MINSVKELQSMLSGMGELESNPIFKRPYMMFSPGCSPDRLRLLSENLRKIPESYLHIITLFTLNGVIIADFELSPYSFKNIDTVEGLLAASEDPFFPKEFMQKHKMYQIGSWNTDILCVTEGTDQFDEGEILVVEEGDDIYNPEDSQIHCLAKDFEQFLIIAGNMEQIHFEMQDKSEEEQRQEFLRRFKLLKIDDKYLNAWLNVS